MGEKSFETGISTEVADSLVSATRTSLGDSLRSVVYFTLSGFDVLYVRQDLYDSETATRRAKSQLVEFERTGFAEKPARTLIAQQEGGSDIGSYRFTVRFHDHGFVVRILGDDDGVLFTADTMDVRAFEEAVSAIEGLFTET
jgi:hypothetical protein